MQRAAVTGWSFNIGVSDDFLEVSVSEPPLLHTQCGVVGDRKIWVHLVAPDVANMLPGYEYSGVNLFQKWRKNVIKNGVKNGKNRCICVVADQLSLLFPRFTGKFRMPYAQ